MIDKKTPAAVLTEISDSFATVQAGYLTDLSNAQPTIQKSVQLTTSDDNYVLAEALLISSPFVKVKIITRGDLTAKIDIETQFASKSAKEAIKKAGGSFKKVAVLQKPKTEKEA